MTYLGAVRELPVIIEEHVSSRSQWSLLTKIKSSYLTVRHPNDHEASTTNVAGFWVHYRERKVDRDCRVNSVAATLEHLHTDLTRNAIRTRHHTIGTVRGNDALAGESPPIGCDKSPGFSFSGAPLQTT